MRNIFSGYYLPSESDFTKLWIEGIFIFDTNVLLNLYSYPEEVRNVFLSVLLKIEHRIWIPYHVGLEFHRNRFSRIKQANLRVEKLLQTIQTTGDQLNSEVKSIELEKRNIGISDIQDRLTAVQNAHKALSEAVELACKKLPPISLDDPIGAAISRLLDNRVGTPPQDQSALDEMLTDAQDRFDKKVPPGFADSDKGDETFRDCGITYPRKFGDLILWRQVIEYAKTKQIKNIVFVTGDRKKDWWWLDDGKTLGPLPELVQEISSNAGVDIFWMYSADQFLKNAEIHLKATEVTAEAVEQVKEVSAQNTGLIDSPLQSVGLTDRVPTADQFKGALGLYRNWSNKTPKGLIDWPETQQLIDSRASRSRGLLDYSNEISVEEAIRNWLIRTYPSCEVIRPKTFPDFVVNDHGTLSGFETKLLRNFSPRAFPPGVVNSLLRGYLEVNEGRISDFSVVLAMPIEEIEYFSDQDWRDEVSRRVSNLLEKYPARSIVIGIVNGVEFEPLLEING